MRPPRPAPPHLLQWVRRMEDGSYSSLDFANSWDSENRISWQSRPANFQLKAGERSKVTKIAENIWVYESADGSILGFLKKMAARRTRECKMRPLIVHRF